MMDFGVSRKSKVHYPPKTEVGVVGELEWALKRIKSMIEVS